SLIEYGVAQRWESATNRDHRFDAWNKDPDKSQWSWLLASTCPSGGVFGDWDPDDRQVKVSWFSPDLSFEALGARPAVVVPIKI
ncbi:MAG: hypothetical protein V1928_00860, partial [Parcubacteria group bacterium]